MTDFDRTTERKAVEYAENRVSDPQHQIMIIDGFTAGRRSVKESLEVLARAVAQIEKRFADEDSGGLPHPSRGPSMAWAMYSDAKVAIAAVTKAGNWPLPSGEKGKGEENGT